GRGHHVNTADSRRIHGGGLPEPALDAVIVDHDALARHQQNFDEHGYTIVRQALSEQAVRALLEVIDAERRMFEQHPHRSPVRDGLNIRPVVDKHPAFRQLLICPRTFGVVAKLLGHYSIQLQQSNLIEARPSAERRLTGWHSDGGIPTIAVNGIRAFASLKVGYFLTDHTRPDTGVLMLVPGSHRLPGPPPFDPQTGNPIGAVQPSLAPGDAVIFHQGTWHAAAPNFGDQARVAVYYGYSYRVMRPVDYQQMPAALLADCTPVERQLLGETVTHQGYYVPTAEDVPLRPWYEAHFGPSTDRGQLERVADVSLRNGERP
ncbi:MAG: phytanoyl-CoA dioxygenase family protein, partial [Gammaproteobacteria bacterium]